MRKLHKPSPQPQQTTPQLPLQAEQSSAAAECTEDSENPSTSNLPQCDSPSNLFSLERHLGGEITKTPQKATKSVPKKIDLANQQQQTHQTTPKQTCNLRLHFSGTLLGSARRTGLLPVCGRNLYNCLCSLFFCSLLLSAAKTLNSLRL